jgi:hypothetical protein
MNIVYIHGASATGDSFNYIRQHLNHPDEIVIEYNSQNGFDRNLADMKNIISNTNNVVFVCSWLRMIGQKLFEVSWEATARWSYVL